MNLVRVWGRCPAHSRPGLSSVLPRHGKPLQHRIYSTSIPQNLNPPRKSRALPWIASLVFISGASLVAYNQYQPFRHSVHALVRCSRVAGAVILGAIDYKRTFAISYDSQEAKDEAYSHCHTRSAHRVLKSLLANGGAWLVDST